MGVLQGCELGETQLRRSGDLKTTIPYRRVGMRRSEAEGSPNEVSPEGVSRGRAAQVSPNFAFGASRLRSKAYPLSRRILG